MGSMEEAVARTDVDLQYNFKQPMNGLLAMSFLPPLLHNSVDTSVYRGIFHSTRNGLLAVGFIVHRWHKADGHVTFRDVTGCGLLIEKQPLVKMSEKGVFYTYRGKFRQLNTTHKNTSIKHKINLRGSSHM